MAKPKQISDDQLLAASRKVFLKHGPNVPVSMIAKRLGVTAGALFYHYASKEELLLAALDPGVPPAIALFRKGFQPDIPAEQQLIAVLTGVAVYMRESIACWFSLRSTGLLQGMEDRYLNNPTKLRPAMTAWVKSAQQRGAIRSGNPKIITETLLSPIEMRFMLVYLTHRSHSMANDRAFVEEVVRDVLHAGQARTRARVRQAISGIRALRAGAGDGSSRAETVAVIK